jgi:hypothetical protein
MSAGCIDAAAVGLAENSSLTTVDIAPNAAQLDVLPKEAKDAINVALGNFADALRRNTTLLTLNLGLYVGNPHASQTAGSIQSTLMLNARLAGMGGADGRGGVDETTQSVMEAMSNAVAAANHSNGRLSPALIKTASAEQQDAESHNGAAQQEEEQQQQPPPPPATPVLNPFASPNGDGSAMTAQNGGQHTAKSSVFSPSPMSMSVQQMGMGGMHATHATQPDVASGSAIPPLGSALLTQQLANTSSLMTMDAIVAARTSWDAEHARDLVDIKRSCAEAARADLMATELKLVDIVGQLATDYARMDENNAKKMAALGEKMNGMVAGLEATIGKLDDRVAALEKNEVAMQQKTDTIIRALHAVESRTNDASYIQQFVAKQYTQLKGELKAEVAKDLNATHEKAVTNLEVNRHIDHSRLDGKCSQLSERLGKLEQTVVTEQQNTVQVLEMLLSDR